MAEAQQNQQPSAQEQLMLAAAQKEQAEAVEAQADTILKQAKADKERAETAKTIAETESLNEDHTLKTIDTLEKLGARVEPPELDMQVIEQASIPQDFNNPINPPLNSEIQQ